MWTHSGHELTLSVHSFTLTDAPIGPGNGCPSVYPIDTAWPTDVSTSSFQRLLFVLFGNAQVFHLGRIRHTWFFSDRSHPLKKSFVRICCNSFETGSQKSVTSTSLVISYSTVPRSTLLLNSSPKNLGSVRLTNRATTWNLTLDGRSTL
jgi:hypothetical protein